MRTLAQASRVATTTGGVHLANPETGKLTKRVNLGPDFEVAWPDDPERQSLIRSHFGARRFAYNWALSCIICDIDAHRDDPEHESVAWNLAGLRKEWNWEKDETAPGGGGTRRSATHQESPTWPRLCLTGRIPSPACEKAPGWGSPSIARSTATRDGCALRPGPCALAMTGAPSLCQSSVIWWPKRTPDGCSATSSKGELRSFQ